MKALPTTYNGTQYRSLLEARYAAWFDLVIKSWPRCCGYDYDCDYDYDVAARVGWTNGAPEVMYEPEAFAGYIPDFVIRRNGFSYVVEIKGLLENFDLGKIRRSGWSGTVICADASGPVRARRYEDVRCPDDEADIECWDYGLLDLSRHDDYCDNPYDQRLVRYQERLWREAGNLVQWRSPRNRPSRT